MSKQITNEELAEITAKLLGTLPKNYKAKFMTELASLICRYAGGQVTRPADDFAGVWLIGIRRDEQLPEDGGVWKDYDLEGEL